VVGYAISGRVEGKGRGDEGGYHDKDHGWSALSGRTRTLRSNVSCLLLQDEFKKIMESRDLYHKLEEMDQMVDKATERKNAGGNPTTGSRLEPESCSLCCSRNLTKAVLLRLAPDSAIRASTVPLKRAEIQRLQAQVREIESANTTMVGEIEEGELYISETRQELDSIKAQMKEVCLRWTGSLLVTF